MPKRNQGRMLGISSESLGHGPRPHRDQSRHYGWQAGHPRHACAVETVLRKLGSGMTAEAVLADHPRLTRDDILAAQAFAADYLASEELVYD